MITCAYGNVSIWLYVDYRLVEFPKVFLKKKPGWLPELCSHLNVHLQLCCTDRSTSSPDRRTPEAVIDLVLSRASNLLEQLVRQGGLVEDEFVLIWGNAADKYPLGFVGDGDIDASDTWRYLKSASTDWSCVVQADQKDQVSRWLGDVKPAACPAPIAIPIDGMLKASNKSWPIRSVKDLSAWLQQIDVNAAAQLAIGIRKFSFAVATGENFNDSIFVLLHHEQGSLGILFDVADLLVWLPRGKRWNPSEAARQVERRVTSASSLDTTKFRMIDVQPTSLIKRVLGNETQSLGGKRIVVVGCGSVGSYLCSALVRSGAGSLGGSLTIIDHDEVGPENLGRSLFDARHLGLNKAEALVEMLKHTMIGAAIEALPSRAPHDPDAYNSDIVIDATGDHGFSTWLSEQRLHGLVPPVLFSWIGGQGVAVASYLQIDSDASCLACLGIADKGSEWNVTVVREGDGHGVQTGPCGESFMPYSVAAPMMASSLALAHLLDLVAQRGGSAFRSIAIHADHGRTVSQTPTACSHKVDR